MPIMPVGERFICRTSAWRSFARRIALWATSHEPLAGDVLEIGGGSGAMAEAVLRRFPDIRLTVADLDPLMVRAIEGELGGRATAVVADATALPFDDASFDVVTSYLMLHHIGTWEDAVTEAVRVLRPGGRFIGYDVVDTGISRAFHHADGIHDLRSITDVSLRAALGAAGVTDVTTRRGRTGLTLRWVARRT
ncbi:MAG TPA: class I SAM-dependent methyltransferase [Jatrophihabitantaceae bacterium]|nr:class I SAM-dependent methyltransferase [Jatrophihabitantaceae bacterium]